jgi:hypothetical protein
MGIVLVEPISQRGIDFFWVCLVGRNETTLSRERKETKRLWFVSSLRIAGAAYCTFGVHGAQLVNPLVSL